MFLELCCTCNKKRVQCLLILSLFSLLVYSTSDFKARMPANIVDDAHKDKHASTVAPQKVRAVILVLASATNSLDRFHKRVWEAYMNKMNTNDQQIFAVHFVYGGGSGMTDACKKDYDLWYPSVPDSYPVRFQKVKNALVDIDGMYIYDFLVRTNLSTFWILQKLLEHLNELPTELCYEGDGPLPPGQPKFYLSGTDTIVNSYMVKELIKKQNLLNYGLPEDATMGSFFHGIMGAPFRDSNMRFLEDFTSQDEQKLQDAIAGALDRNQNHFRVKNIRNDNREEIDGWILTKLLNHYYNETVTSIENDDLVSC